MNLSNKIRKDTLQIGYDTNNGHIASAMSIVEILIALYEHKLTDNDKFILSKGHACLSWYAMLRYKGCSPDVSKGHPDIDIENGIHCTTGSLGHGLPVGVGMALAKKLKKEKGNIYVVTGDGELQEGSIWESLLIASHHKLDNLTIIIDYNGLQALDDIDRILSLDSLANKITAFNCTCMIVRDGHNVKQILEKLNDNEHRMYNEPKVIVAYTVKGKGYQCMENNPEWHNKLPNKDEL